jgi:hypothetical protein
MGMDLYTSSLATCAVWISADSRFISAVASIVEIVRKDMHLKGLIQPDAASAGHSLGGLSVLASVADILPIPLFLASSFISLTMQHIVRHGEQDHPITPCVPPILAALTNIRLCCYVTSPE